MAGNFYYKQTKITEDDIYTNSRLRDNAFVTITAGNFQLPIPTNNMSSTYNPEGTGRAAPVLKDVKISLEGEAASLRRADVSFTCFDKTSFETAEAALLIPGSEVTIKYGYVGPTRSTQSAEYVFRVYDYSFKITKENYFECSFKGVAKGTGAEFDLLDINGLQSFPNEEFVTNFNGGNDTAKVKNLFDYLDWQVQKVSGEIDDWEFDPPNGTCGKLESGGHFGVIVAPDDYEPDTKLRNGLLSFDRIIYVTLEAIVNAINKYVLKGNENGYQIKFDDSYSAINLSFPAGRIFSPEPFNVLFAYQKGTDENFYGLPFTSENNRINCDVFYKRNITAFNDFRIDANGPKGILISRDMLRSIQNSFNTKSLDEDESTEKTEKSDASINLNEFFKKIFAVIRDCSGGDWNLSLEKTEGDLDSNDEAQPGAIWIVNKNSPAKNPSVQPLMLRPVSGRNGIREIALSGEVPKDIQAQAFGGAPTVTKEKIAADAIAGKPTPEDKVQKEIDKLKEELPLAKIDLNRDSYSADSVTAAKGLIKRLVNALSVEEWAKKNKLLEPTPYPLKLSVTLDGIEGFRFGDTITSDYLPSRYTANKGVRTVFTITKYTHTIAGNDWKTQLETVCRLVKDD